MEKNNSKENDDLMENDNSTTENNLTEDTKKMEENDSIKEDLIEENNSMKENDRIEKDDAIIVEEDNQVEKDNFDEEELIEENSIEGNNQIEEVDLDENTNMVEENDLNEEVDLIEGNNPIEESNPMEDNDSVEEIILMEENNSMEEKPLEELDLNEGPNATRMEKHKTKSINANKFRLLQLILVILVVISLASNIFMFTKYNDDGSSNSSNNNAKVQQVNYDVKSTTSDVIKKVSDSVVGVLVYSNGAASGSGSGVVYRVNGRTAYIITNAHVVDGANDVQVVFSNKESVKATVLGSDSYSDIAVLKLTADFDLSAIKCGDSTLLDQGETVLAIGSPLGIEYAGTVTQGIVSGIDRTVSVDLNDDGQDDWDMNVIQTDAAINPGNSGGALVNMAGELIGITSMKLSDTSVEGMGFALPINDVIKSVEQIIENGKVTRPQFGISGVSLSGYSSYQLRYYRINTDLTDGIYVAKVSAGGAASNAGIQEGDIIVKFGDDKITTYKSFLTALYAKEPGDKVSVVINRNGSEKTVEVTLGEQ